MDGENVSMSLQNARFNQILGEDKVSDFKHQATQIARQQALQRHNYELLMDDISDLEQDLSPLTAIGDIAGLIMSTAAQAYSGFTSASAMSKAIDSGLIEGFDLKSMFEYGTELKYAQMTGDNSYFLNNAYKNNNPVAYKGSNGGGTNANSASRLAPPGALDFSYMPKAESTNWGLVSGMMNSNPGMDFTIGQQFPSGNYSRKAHTRSQPSPLASFVVPVL
jgi:hypothetical protein